MFVFSRCTEFNFEIPSFHKVPKNQDAFSTQLHYSSTSDPDNYRINSAPDYSSDETISEAAFENSILFYKQQIASSGPEIQTNLWIQLEHNIVSKLPEKNNMFDYQK